MKVNKLEVLKKIFNKNIDIKENSIVLDHITNRSSIAEDIKISLEQDIVNFDELKDSKLIIESFDNEYYDIELNREKFDIDIKILKKKNNFYLS